MRILHVIDIAGVPSLLVQGLREKGIEADLISRRPHPYGFPHETVLKSSAPEFLFRMLKLSRSYHIVHTHALPYKMFFNVNIFALKALKQGVLVHLHGTEIRKSHNKPWTKAALGICDGVLVGTPDLLSYYPNAVWLPTPIDPLFKPLNNPQRFGKALYFRKWYEPQMEKVVRIKCNKMGLELTVPNKPIPYSGMPRFLNQFEVFFDRFGIRSLSKTALEALACGCKVISWKGVVANCEEILQNHNLRVVTEKLLGIYKKVLSELTT